MKWERMAETPYISGSVNGGDKEFGISYTDRAKVPGGWIYRTYRFYFNQATESSVFVPSPDGR